MTKQLNETGLMVEGFNKVAVYKKFDKLPDGRWSCEIATCWQKNNECVIKLSPEHFTLYYTNKDLANKKIKNIN